MLKIENVEVIGWEHAIRGMRNPMNSWGKSDSCWRYGFPCGPGYAEVEYSDDATFYVGPNDRELMKKLSAAGTDHRKFMRMIVVYLDIVAPLYWWKEFDTYKIGTVANSGSTMHKIAEKEFRIDDFSTEHLFPEVREAFETSIIKALNIFRDLYLGFDGFKEQWGEHEKKEYWWQMIQLLPSSYNQRRTIMLNYEVLANIYKSRRNHKLDEWHTLCDWIETLPCHELITGGSENESEHVEDR